MNFYEILKTKKLGRGSPDYWTQLFAEHVGGKGEWKVAELTGTLPITFHSNGTALINYRIFGTADGAGVQTENLAEAKIEKSNINANGQIISNPDYSTWVVPVNQGVTYTFTTNGAVYAEYTEYPVLGSVAYNNKRVIATTTFTATIDGYIAFRTTSNYATAMCVIGSTAPEIYIPHGYKLPLTVESGETESKDTDIYIGDSKLGAEEYVDYESKKLYRWADITGLSEPLCSIDTYTDSLDLSTGTLTRRIKKLVLTGEEISWAQANRRSDVGGVYFYLRFIHFSNTVSGRIVCSHFVVGNPYNGTNDCVYNALNNNITDFRFNHSSSDSIDAFKSYLAAQYAAGTPVTVWYALAEPEVSTIPVPSGLTGTIEGYLIQDGTPTPEAPIYPTANGVKQADGTYTIESVGLVPTDPPLPLHAIETFNGENTLDSTEILGEVTIKGQIKPQS